MADSHEQVVLRQLVRDELRSLEIIPGLRGSTAHGSAFWADGFGGRSGRELHKWIVMLGQELDKEGKFFSTRRTIRGVRAYARGTPVEEKYRTERQKLYRVDELDDSRWLRDGKRIMTGSGAIVARAVDERAAATIIRRCKADRSAEMAPGETPFFAALAKWLGVPSYRLRGEAVRLAFRHCIDELDGEDTVEELPE